jgi:acetoacetyl-CoA synthetase
MPGIKLWEPPEHFKKSSNLWKYLQWVNENHNSNFADYDQLWQWSVDNPSAFWESIWKYFDILYEGVYTQVMSSDPMPFVKWFEGTRLNYAEHIFRNARPNETAIRWRSEERRNTDLTWNDVRHQTASLQKLLRSHGVSEGDRVAAYLPCIPEATIAFLGSNALGAIWSSCSPDFGSQAVVDRFAQIQPKVLFAVDEYRYGGKKFSRTEVVNDLLKAIPSIKVLIMISATSHNYTVDHCHSWNDVTAIAGDDIEFKRVPFDHPIWVLYSSGTTGLPKAITHSHGGILLEQLKYGSFHNDFRPGENCFWYTTTGWMMWNYIHGSLLSGGTMVLYDGSPGYPDLNVLWNFIAEARIAHFGTSAGFILACMKDKLASPAKFDLSSLRSIGSTGSTLPPEGFEWIYEHVKKDVWLTSMSGGTDVCSAFVGGNPLTPVFDGEIQCRALGCALYAFDESGNPVSDEEGEMVITAPMPSMPVFFWNDPDFKRYTESYFEMYPGVWRHGDWIKVTERNGIVIYGRSDATLNRGGVRIGTSEVYRAVDQVAEVKDSLIICVEKSGGDFWMPLFVVLREGVTLDDPLRRKIAQTIRSATSPRHVPDEIISTRDIPYTISGKKTETPVKKIFMGKDVKSVISAGSLRNPDSLEFFVALQQAMNL